MAENYISPEVTNEISRREENLKQQEDEISRLSDEINSLSDSLDKAINEKTGLTGEDAVKKEAEISYLSQKLANERAKLRALTQEYNLNLDNLVYYQIQNTTPNLGTEDGVKISPFDYRLYRIITNGSNGVNITNTIISGNDLMPYEYNSRKVWTAIEGYGMSPETFAKKKKLTNDKLATDKAYQSLLAYRNKMMKDPLYQGVPALTNNYAVVKLFGSEGGKLLVNKRNQRKFYEINDAQSNRDTILNSSMSPTTTNLISWGNADPFGRLPYAFTDFVFCKYWNKIANNRLLTLRRYASPIVDNLNFPGMDGSSTDPNLIIPTKDGSTGSNDKSESLSNTGGNSSTNSGVSFPPVATVVSYFGEETGNKLSEILKFTTGVKWGEAEGKVFDVTSDGNMGSDANPKGFGFGMADKISKALNVVNGDWNFEAQMHGQQLPPDPYEDGPYANKVKGPINRIDKVKKRDPGIEFKMDNLKLTFEYVARPIGGINTKAVLLDILSNFLVVGSASAVFFGGQHRFNIKPAAMPFIGGQGAAKSLYNGDITGFFSQSITRMQGQFNDILGSFGDMLKDMISSFTSGNFLESLEGAANSKIGKNLQQGIAAAMTGDKAIPQLHGMRALLTGEPVGEWHLTVGNPLNPIALIGNLICENIEIEFGDELGPDDFPLELKVVVNLKHGMDRDRDAIQSMFNRGMGRIYDIPTNLKTSSESETKVDNKTGNDSPSYMKDSFYQDYFGTGGRSWGKASTSIPSNVGTTSVFQSFSYAFADENEFVSFDSTASTPLNRSVVKYTKWIGDYGLG